MSSDDIKNSWNQAVKRAVERDPDVQRSKIKAKLKSTYSVLFNRITDMSEALSESTRYSSVLIDRDHFDLANRQWSFRVMTKSKAFDEAGERGEDMELGINITLASASATCRNGGVADFTGRDSGIYAPDETAILADAVQIVIAQFLSSR